MKDKSLAKNSKRFLPNPNDLSEGDIQGDGLCVSVERTSTREARSGLQRPTGVRRE